MHPQHSHRPAPVCARPKHNRDVPAHSQQLFQQVITQLQMQLRHLLKRQEVSEAQERASLQQ
eukprot:7080969-Lingulodinium_polyedra.AAC.1